MTMTMTMTMFMRRQTTSASGRSKVPLLGGEINKRHLAIYLKRGLAGNSPVRSL